MFATFINVFGTDRDAKLGPDGAGSAQKGDFPAILSPKRRVQVSKGDKEGWPSGARVFATFINAFGTDRDAKLGPDGAGSAQIRKK